MPGIGALYTGPGEESQETERLLRGAGFEFEKFFLKDPAAEEEVVPQLITGQGSFRRLDGIRWYI